MEHHHPSVDDATLNAHGDDTGSYSSTSFPPWQPLDELSIPSFDETLGDIINNGAFWNNSEWDNLVGERNGQDNGDAQPIVATASTSRLSPPRLPSQGQQYTSDIIAPHGLDFAPPVLPSPSPPSPPSTAHSALFTPSALTFSTPHSDFSLDLTESGYAQAFGMSLPPADDAASYQGASRQQRLQEAYEATLGTVTHVDTSAWREDLPVSAPAELNPLAPEGLQAFTSPTRYSDLEVPRFTAADMYRSWGHLPPSHDIPLRLEAFPTAHAASENWGSLSFVGDQIPTNAAGWDPHAGTQSRQFTKSAQGTSRECAPPVYPSPIYSERPAGSAASQNPARQRFVPSSASSSRPATRKRKSSEEPEGSSSKCTRYSDPAQYPSTAGPSHFSPYYSSSLAGPSHAQPPVFDLPNPLASAPLPAPHRSRKRARDDDDDDDDDDASTSPPALKRPRKPRGTASGARKAPRRTRNTRRSSAIGTSLMAFDAPVEERKKHRGRFTCAIPSCSKTFADWSSARRHIRCIHRADAEPGYRTWFEGCTDENLRRSLGQPLTRPADSRPRCTHCGRPFSRDDAVLRHMNNGPCPPYAPKEEEDADGKGKGKGKGKEKEREE